VRAHRRMEIIRCWDGGNSGQPRNSIYGSSTKYKLL
jgi:hypothetical protein